MVPRDFVSALVCLVLKPYTRFVVFPVVLHVVLHVVPQELLHPSRFLVFPVGLHVVLHVELQELLHPSRFAVFPANQWIRILKTLGFDWFFNPFKHPHTHTTDR